VPEVVLSALVERTPREMFALVDAVEDYPQFLPWCGAATVIQRDEAVTRATIEIDYRGIRQSFTTENLKRLPEEMSIRLIEGPFRRLEGGWRFTALGAAGCKVELRLDYELGSALLAPLLAPVFDHIANTLVESFVKRAEQIGR